MYSETKHPLVISFAHPDGLLLLDMADKGLRNTSSYRRMMVLVGKAVGSNRSDRLELASSLLEREVDSFTSLSREDIEFLIDMLLSWEKTQTVRLANGVLFTESMMICDMIEQDIPYLSEKSILSDTQSRKKYTSMREITQKDMQDAYQKSDFSDFASNVLSATSKLSDTVTTIPEANHGRWAKHKVIQAPTTGLGLELGAGGFPRGKIFHFYGAKHSGKSMIAYQIAAMSQKQGIPVVIVDAEAAMDADFAENLGLDLSPELLKIVLPGNIEELSNLLIELSDKPYTIIVDSIASSASKIELTRDRSKKSARVGGTAIEWSNTLSVIRTRLLRSGCTLVLINQVRKNMDAGMYGDPNRPWGSDVIQHQVDISFYVTSANAKDNLKDRGYKISRLHMKKNRFDDMTDVKIDMPFKPGFPYNKSIDHTISCEKSIGSGVPVVWGELADNVFRANHSATDDGTGIISKNGRFTLRIDPVMMKAILFDDEDFDAVDIEPSKDWEVPEDGNWSGADIPDTDTENSEFFTLPGLGVINAIKWLSKHPSANELIGQRMLNALNRKRDVIEQFDRESGIE